MASDHVEPTIEVCPVEVLGDVRWKWRIIFDGDYTIDSQGHPAGSRDLAIDRARSQLESLRNAREILDWIYHGQWESI